MTQVPKVNKMSFWARRDKNLQGILQSVRLKQAQGRAEMQSISSMNTVTAVDIMLFPDILVPCSLV